MQQPNESSSSRSPYNGAAASPTAPRETNPTTTFGNTNSVPGNTLLCSQQAAVASSAPCDPSPIAHAPPTPAIPPASEPQRYTWTDIEIAMLVRLREQGDGHGKHLSWADISKSFRGKSPNACRKRFERFGKGILGRPTQHPQLGSGHAGPAPQLEPALQAVGARTAEVIWCSNHSSQPIYRIIVETSTSRSEAGEPITIDSNREYTPGVTIQTVCSH